jgi:hypothetical protein
MIKVTVAPSMSAAMQRGMSLADRSAHVAFDPIGRAVQLRSRGVRT